MNRYAPKYIVIKNYILNEIKNENLQIGDKIPSENELSKKFNVSRVTANVAIKELVILGIVERIQGKGSFVREKEIVEEELYHEFTKSIKISSEFCESRNHHLENISIIETNDALSTKLNLNFLDKVYKIERYMMRDNEIIGIDYSYIPCKHILDEEKIDFEKLSSTYLHDFISEIVGIELKYIRIHIDAKLPNAYECEKIKVPENFPLVIWDTNILDSNNRVIAFTTTIANPKKYRAYINFEI